MNHAECDTQRDVGGHMHEVTGRTRNGQGSCLGSCGGASRPGCLGGR